MRLRSAPLSSALLLLLTAPLAGCTAGVATLQPATALPAGKVELSAGLAVHAPIENTAALVTTATEGIKSSYANDPNHAPTDAERETLGRAVVGAFFNPPMVQPEFAGRVGVGGNVDVGLRLSGKAIHAQVKWQFLKADGWDGALVGGLFGQTYSSELAAGSLEFARFATSHFGGDVSLLFGKNFGDYGFFYAGPRYQGQRVAAGIEILHGAGIDVATGSHLFGGVLGGAVGYKHLFFVGELTGGYVRCAPTVLGRSVDVGGTLLVPAVGVLTRF